MYKYSQLSDQLRKPKNRVKEKRYEYVYFKMYDYLCFFYGA